MTEAEALYSGVKIMLYTIFFGGIAFLSKNWVLRQTAKFRMRHRLRARRRMMMSRGVLEHHLANLITVSLGRKVSVKSFLWLSTLIFFAVFAVGMQSMTIIGTVVSAMFVSLLPYLALRVRLEARRRRGSFEGERLVSEFLNQYSMCGLNIFEAIEKTALHGKNMKISRTLLYQLLLEFRSIGGPEDIKKAVEKFAYGLDTNWGRMLANNIRTAAEKGIDVSGSIEDVLIQLREARAAVEERKRLNSESSRMVMFLIPALYAGTILMSVKYLELPISAFIRNQFYTTQGFVLFLTALILFGLNILLLEFVSHQRFDF